jgi:hypothetical protein
LKIENQVHVLPNALICCSFLFSTKKIIFFIPKSKHLQSGGQIYLRKPFTLFFSFCHAKKWCASEEKIYNIIMSMELPKPPYNQ